MSRRWIGVAFVAAGLLALGAGMLWRQAGNEATSSRSTNADGATLFALALPDVAGKDQPMAQWKGKVLVVNFWATWCEPCREEMPRFMKLQEQYGGKGLQFVGIAIDQADKVQQFTTNMHLNYPSLIGGYGGIELSRSFGNAVGALPFTLVVDRAGRIVQTKLGPMKDEQLQPIIDQLLLTSSN
jgi:thiol-disulfide isomerase/thioredoxin